MVICLPFGFMLSVCAEFLGLKGVKNPGGTFVEKSIPAVDGSKLRKEAIPSKTHTSFWSNEPSTASVGYFFLSMFRRSRAILDLGSSRRARSYMARACLGSLSFS